MRTPQRVEQFQKELEIKKAKALRRQQAAAETASQAVAEIPKDVLAADSVVNPAVIDEAPAADTQESVLQDASQESQEVEVAAESPAEPEVVVESTVSTTSRKRRS